MRLVIFSSGRERSGNFFTENFQAIFHNLFPPLREHGKDKGGVTERHLCSHTSDQTVLLSVIDMRKRPMNRCFSFPAKYPNNPAEIVPSCRLL